MHTGRRKNASCLLIYNPQALKILGSSSDFRHKKKKSLSEITSHTHACENWIIQYIVSFLRKIYVSRVRRNFHFLGENTSPIIHTIDLKTKYPSKNETAYIHIYITVNLAIGEYFAPSRNLFTRPHLASTRT